MKITFYELVTLTINASLVFRYMYVLTTKVGCLKGVFFNFLLLVIIYHYKENYGWEPPMITWPRLPAMFIDAGMDLDHSSQRMIFPS